MPSTPTPAARPSSGALTRWGVRTPLTPELPGALNVPEEIGSERLCEFPDFVAMPRRARAAPLTTYLLELAGEFQSYYTRLQKVNGDTILPPRNGSGPATGDPWDWQQDRGHAWPWVGPSPGHEERASPAGRQRAGVDAAGIDRA